MSYWRGHDYVGLGTAAYGFATIARDERGESRAIRYRNQPDPKLYVDGCRNIVHGEPNLGDRVTSTVERLDAETLMRERIMLGLRIAEGVDLDRAARELGLPRDKVWTDARQKTLQRLVARGDVVAEGSVVRMAAGRRLATDGVAMRLF